MCMCVSMYVLSHACAGVRYFMRGVDKDGHVANYVETEQIIFYKQYKTSFVQVRLSITVVCICDTLYHILL